MMTPQLTAQYGQVLRVSVVREIFRLSACARIGCGSKPKTVTPTAPAIPVLKNARLETSMAQASRTNYEQVNCGKGRNERAWKATRVTDDSARCEVHDATSRLSATENPHP